MNQLPLSARIYATAIVLAAFGVMTSGCSRGSNRCDPIGSRALHSPCSGLIVVATLRPLPLSFKRKLVLDTGVLVAAVLLLPAGVAVLVGATGTLLVHAVRRDDWIQAVFNASQVALVTAAAAFVLRAAGVGLRDGAFDRPAAEVAILVAGVAMYVVSNVVVATMVALQSGMSPVDVWLRVARQVDGGEVLGHLAQVGLGAIVAISLTVTPWSLPLALLPAVAVYVLVGRYVRARWEAEAALQASAANLTEIERVGRVGRWEWDLTTGIHVWSDEARRILGRPPGASPPTFATLLEAVHPADRSVVDRAIHAALSEGTAFSVDHRVRLPDGAERTVHQEGAPDWDDAGRKIRLVGTVRDITERTTLEAQVEDIAERHRAAADLADARGQLGASRELERLRLARELHDGPLQDLIAVSYQLAISARSTEDGPTATVLEPDVVRQEVLAVVRQLRSVIGELRPPGLEELGLAAALEGYAANLRQQGGPSLPAIVLDADGPLVGMPEPLALSLFRVAQEAIRNAIRHADARSICIRLRHDGRSVDLEVSDDGRGFAVPPRLNDLTRTGHYGLVGLAERVDHARGTLAIRSSIGAGTRIAVRLPLVAPTGAHDRPGAKWSGPGDGGVGLGADRGDDELPTAPGGRDGTDDAGGGAHEGLPRGASAVVALGHEAGPVGGEDEDRARPR